MASYSGSTTITASKRMFTSEQWAEMYPKSEYTSRSARSQKCTLHFLLALDQPEKTITNILDKSTAKLYTPDNECYGFTPLMIAVMQGKDAIALAMLRKAVTKETIEFQIKHQDHHGWTIFHHAAFSSNRIFQEMRIYIDPNNFPSTILGGLPWDVSLLTDLNYRLRLKDNAFFLENGIEKYILTMSSEELKSKLGLQAYRTVPYYPPHEIGRLWKKKHDLSKTSYGVNIKPIQDLWEAPPKLIVRKCQVLQVAVPNALELVAGEDIPEGQLVTMFGGEYSSEKKPLPTFKEVLADDSAKSANKLKRLYAHNIGNIARFANCGFPNMILSTAYVHGTLITVYRSLGIKKGEPILWNYMGLISLQFGKFHIFGREEMRKYFDGGILKFKERCNKYAEEKAKEGPDNTIWLIAEFTRLGFPLMFPSAMLDLHYSGIFKASDLLYELMYGRYPLMYDVIRHQCFGTVYHRLFLKYIISMDETLEWHPEGKKVVTAWILEKIGHLSIMQFVKVFERVTTTARNGILSTEEDWKAFIAAQETEIANYVWSEDPEPPISLTQRIRLLIQDMSSNPKPFLDQMKKQLIETNQMSDLLNENLQVYRELEAHFRM